MSATQKVLKGFTYVKLQQTLRLLWSKYHILMKTHERCFIHEVDTYEDEEQELNDDSKGCTSELHFPVFEIK